MSNKGVIVGRFAAAVGGAWLVIGGCTATRPLKPAPEGAALRDPTCLTQTGDLVAAPATGCRGIGRSYSKEDIDRTGQPTAAAALGQLDPSITVHH